MGLPQHGDVPDHPARAEHRGDWRGADPPETVIGAALRDGSIAAPKPEDFTRSAPRWHGAIDGMPDGDSSVLAQGRRRVEIVELSRWRRRLRQGARWRAADESREVGADACGADSVPQCVGFNPQLPEEAYIYALNVESPMASRSGRVHAQPEHGRAARPLRWSIPSSGCGAPAVCWAGFEVLELEESIHSQVRQEVDRTRARSAARTDA